MENSKLSFVALYLVLGSILYFIAVVIYRLYFSPVACFPGSKLTAATGWVETYYDVVNARVYMILTESLKELSQLHCTLYSVC